MELNGYRQLQNDNLTRDNLTGTDSNCMREVKMYNINGKTVIRLN